MGRTRIVKLSEEEYQLLQDAKKALIKNGTNGLPKEVNERINQDNRLADFALGAIVGVGAVALLALLLGSSDS
jgi:hypothetical protein